MTDDVQVVQTLQWDDLDPTTGKLRTRIRVKWMLGSNGPFYEYFPVDNFNGADARTKIEERAAQLRLLQP